MSVVNPALDETELDDGQGADDKQENDRLGRRRAQVLADETVGIDLVDKDRRGLLRAAGG